jgi:hypothetical protein
MRRLSETLERYLGLEPDNPTEYGKRAGNWRRILKHRSGMTPTVFEDLFNLQNGVCAICKEPPAKAGKSRLFHVDHDTTTKLIRGLLCTRCNTALGLFRESAINLEVAAMYLLKSPAEQLQPRPRMVREQRDSKLFRTAVTESPEGEWHLFPRH